MSSLPDLDSIDLRIVLTAVISSIFGTTGFIFFIGRTWIEARIKSGIDKVCKKELEEHRANLSIETEKVLSKLRQSYEDEVDARSADKTLFSEFIRLIPSNGMAVAFLESAYCGPFDWDDFRPIQRFLDDWRGPQFEFLDPELESMKVDFREKVQKFSSRLSSHTGLEKHGRYWVSGEFKMQHENAYEKFLKESASYAQDAMKAYEVMVRTGRKKLKVLGNVRVE